MFSVIECFESKILNGIYAHQGLDSKSLTQRIPGVKDIEERDQIAQKYTEDAPQ